MSEALNTNKFHDVFKAVIVDLRYVEARILLKIVLILVPSLDLILLTIQKPCRPKQVTNYMIKLLYSVLE